MNYEQAIKYIHSVSNFFCKPGLERIRELCSGLGNPQDKLRFIHVGGTNGKGSFCAMTDSILRKAGYKVGLFTSPYVREFNERMRVNGENIPNETLARLTEKAKAVAEKMKDSPTEFELICAIAFDYFLEEKCDVVILEVGMGGKLDATNIITSPCLSVITGIALDHTAFLGDTIELIAGEKAGIIKENSTVIFGGEDPVAEAVISKKATEMKTKLYKPDYSKLKIESFDLSGTSFSYKEKNRLHISLLGSYQPRNAAVVLEAIDRLNESGFNISLDNIRDGLRDAKWSARFEILSKNPIFIFDGAHNAQGISAACESIKSYFDKKVIVITGVLKDKDYITIAKDISAASQLVYTITPENPRALSAEDYAKVLCDMGACALPCSSIGEALTKGIDKAKEMGLALFCLGSLYTYSDVVGYLEKTEV